MTYPCLFKGQEIKIILFANDWLHIGTVVCPSCQQLCPFDTETGKPFKCKSDVSKNKVAQLISETKAYHRDTIICSAAATGIILTNYFSVIALLLVGIICSVSVSTTHCNQYSTVKPSWYWVLFRVSLNIL
jgi:hypothetical protein